MISRWTFLNLAGRVVGATSVGLLVACGRETSTSGPDERTPAGQRKVGSEAERGRLLVKPRPPSRSIPSIGLQSLGLDSGRDGLLYVPDSYEAEEAPLVLMLHGAGSDARRGISPFIDLADEAGLLLLAPDSRGSTWDVLVGGYGPDVEFIDRALEQTFARLGVDPGKMAVAGFSDGASYALSLGLTNGKLFTHSISFSPGFMAPKTHRGEPSIFVSHGTRDEVLPIEQTSQRIVPRLERSGYSVLYREFDGGHTVPPEIAREAVDWFVREEA